jgi:hypothetical protein
MTVNDQDIAQQIQYAKAAKTKWLQHGLTCYDDEVDITFALAEGLASVEIRAQMLLVVRQRRKNTEHGRKVLKEMYPNKDHEDPNAKF